MESAKRSYAVDIDNNLKVIHIDASVSKTGKRVSPKKIF